MESLPLLVPHQQDKSLVGLDGREEIPRKSCPGTGKPINRFPGQLFLQVLEYKLSLDSQDLDQESYVLFKAINQSP